MGQHRRQHSRAKERRLVALDDPAETREEDFPGARAQAHDFEGPRGAGEAEGAARPTNLPRLVVTFANRGSLLAACLTLPACNGLFYHPTHESYRHLSDLPCRCDDVRFMSAD